MPKMTKSKYSYANLPKPISFGLIAFLASWQATEFSLEYRSVMGAIVAGLMGFLNPELSGNTPTDT
jgi:tetrahydromethanopterin S-methyltransferase subunit E